MAPYVAAPETVSSFASVAVTTTIPAKHKATANDLDKLMVSSSTNLLAISVKTPLVLLRMLVLETVVLAKLAL